MGVVEGSHREYMVCGGVGDSTRATRTHPTVMPTCTLLIELDIVCFLVGGVGGSAGGVLPNCAREEVVWQSRVARSVREEKES